MPRLCHPGIHPNHPRFLSPASIEALSVNTVCFTLREDAPEPFQPRNGTAGAYAKIFIAPRNGYNNHRRLDFCIPPPRSILGIPHRFLIPWLLRRTKMQRLAANAARQPRRTPSGTEGGGRQGSGCRGCDQAGLPRASCGGKAERADRVR